MKTILDWFFNSNGVMNRKTYFLANMLMFTFIFIFIILLFLIIWIAFPHLEVDTAEHYLNILASILIWLFLIPWIFITIKRWRDFDCHNWFLYSFLFIIILWSILYVAYTIFPDLLNRYIFAAIFVINIIWIIFYLIFQFIPTKKLWEESLWNKDVNMIYIFIWVIVIVLITLIWLILEYFNKKVENISNITNLDQTHVLDETSIYPIDMDENEGNWTFDEYNYVSIQQEDIYKNINDSDTIEEQINIITQNIIKNRDNISLSYYDWLSNESINVEFNKYRNDFLFYFGKYIAWNYFAKNNVQRYSKQDIKNFEIEAKIALKNMFESNLDLSISLMWMFVWESSKGFIYKEIFWQNLDVLSSQYVYSDDNYYSKKIDFFDIYLSLPIELSQENKQNLDKNSFYIWVQKVSSNDLMNIPYNKRLKTVLFWNEIDKKDLKIIPIEINSSPIILNLDTIDNDYLWKDNYYFYRVYYKTGESYLALWWLEQKSYELSRDYILSSLTNYFSQHVFYDINDQINNFDLDEILKDFNNNKERARKKIDYDKFEYEEKIKDILMAVKNKTDFNKKEKELLKYYIEVKKMENILSNLYY